MKDILCLPTSVAFPRLFDTVYSQVVHSINEHTVCDHMLEDKFPIYNEYGNKHVI